MTTTPPYKRILLKLSGEALMGSKSYGIDTETLDTVAREIEAVHSMGLEVAIVIGGGNIFRGFAASAAGMDRASADHMGMLATCINGLALQDALERRNLPTRAMSAIAMDQICEPYIRRRAVRHLEKGRIVIFVAGLGDPYFTTDTAASLRAMEINADVLLKGTKVDGVYDKDPAKHEDAVKFDSLSFHEVLNRELRVMDTTAISLCKDNNLPIIVFKLMDSGHLKRIVQGETLGTLVRSRHDA